MAMWTGHHRGLRAGHVSKGVTRELERAACFLTLKPEQGTGYSKALASAGRFRLLASRKEHETKEAGQVSGSEPKAKRPEMGKRQS